MTKDQFDELYALFATLANLEQIDESGDPNTASLREIQLLGTEGLDLLDGIDD